MASAQIFLRSLLPESKYESGGLLNNYDKIRAEGRRTGWGWNFDGAPLIKSVETTARCVDMVTVDFTHYRVTYFKGSQLADFTSKFTNGQATQQLEFGYKDLLSVTAVGESVSVRWRGSDRASMIGVGSETQALRIANALEFLRQNCDPATETGF